MRIKYVETTHTRQITLNFSTSRKKHYKDSLNYSKWDHISVSTFTVVQDLRLQAINLSLQQSQE